MVVDQTTWQLDCPKTGVANLRDVRLKLSLDKKWDTYLLKQRYNWYTIATQIANYLLISSLINEERLDINGIFIKYSHKIPFFFQHMLVTKTRRRVRSLDISPYPRGTAWRKLVTTAVVSTPTTRCSTWRILTSTSICWTPSIATTAPLTTT